MTITVFSLNVSSVGKRPFKAGKYILITNTRCSVVALTAVIKFIVVEVFNDEGPPNNRDCKETQFSSKNG